MKSLISILALCLSLACSLTTPVEEEPQPVLVESPVSVVYDTPSEPTPDTCIVTAHVLRLRTCGGLDCPVQDWLEQGEVLQVHQSVDDWIEVTTPAYENGWVNSHYCGGAK